MKIEKINDRQIRCTLTREDLASRELKLSELAYGSDKAKALFQDMMQLAARDFGFEADNIPLMIEAIPVSMDTIVLIITKVEDPDELDTRFAKFTPEDSEPDDDFSLSSLRDKIEGADDVLGLIRKITEAKKQAAAKAAAKRLPKLLLPIRSRKIHKTLRRQKRSFGISHVFTCSTLWMMPSRLPACSAPLMTVRMPFTKIRKTGSIT